MTKRDTIRNQHEASAGVPLLTDHQELLLCRHFDGETGWWSGRAAARLLRKNFEARDFYEGLSRVSSQVRSYERDVSDQRSGAIIESPLASSVENIGSIDLWAKIEQRIDAEEKAAFFLGERRNNRASRDLRSWSASSMWEKFKTMQAVWGGLSGAAVTALVLFVIGGTPTGAPQFASTQRLLSGNGAGAATVSQVSFGGDVRMSQTDSDRGILPVIVSGPLNKQRYDAGEVDWMRGGGPVKFVQNPGEKSTIIWVKRRSPSRNRDRAASENQRRELDATTLSPVQPRLPQ